LTSSKQALFVPGFNCAAVSCGLKPQTAAYGGRSLDLALITSEKPCAAAGVFTGNQFPAAPVLYDREVLQANPEGIRAVVVNSGNANACTGAQGLADTRGMARLVEETLQLPVDSALIMSTGVIGLPLPMDRIKAGIRGAAAELQPTQNQEAVLATAQAIMTTDTQPKLSFQRAGTASLLGIAKGAAMIHPNMATMLVLLMTDAAVPASDLPDLLRRAVKGSFNAITVDGDQSTNDTALLLANGLAGSVDGEDFERALVEVCQELAQAMVRDAEGSSKFVTVQVTGAPSQGAAFQVARTIAASVLVKTAIYGGDPNWGRVLMAAGNSGVALDPACVALWFSAGDQSLQVVAGGAPLPYDEAVAAAIFGQAELRLHLDLGLGEVEASVWTSDLTHEYVTLNAHYRT
jgi:glutamate N-acetyltransferase/amino-acid N-acetyltransferase